MYFWRREKYIHSRLLFVNFDCKNSYTIPLAWNSNSNTNIVQRTERKSWCVVFFALFVPCIVRRVHNSNYYLLLQCIINKIAWMLGRVVPIMMFMFEWTMKIVALKCNKLHSLFPLLKHSTRKRGKWWRRRSQFYEKNTIPKLLWLHSFSRYNSSLSVCNVVWLCVLKQARASEGGPVFSFFFSLSFGFYIFRFNFCCSFEIVWLEAKLSFPRVSAGWCTGSFFVGEKKRLLVCNFPQKRKTNILHWPA